MQWRFEPEARPFRQPSDNLQPHRPGLVGGPGRKEWQFDNTWQCAGSAGYRRSDMKVSPCDIVIVTYKEAIVVPVEKFSRSWRRVLSIANQTDKAVVAGRGNRRRLPRDG